MSSALSRFFRFSPIVFAFLLAPAGLSPAVADQDEPIASIGHGAFFDGSGNQIAVTLEFVTRAQEWYRTALLGKLSDRKKGEFASFERRLNDGIDAEGQTLLMVRQLSLDWLVANTSMQTDDPRTLGKIRALKYELNWKLPEHEDLNQQQNREEFDLDPQFEEKLERFGSIVGEVQVLSATMNSGQAYLNECSIAGVPIPPSIGQLDPLGLTGWKTQGFIPSSAQFIVGTPAEVQTFQSSSPPGMCIALPRYVDTTRTTVRLDGVICLGQSNKVCIWDNQMNGNGFSFPAGTMIPIGVPDLAVNPDGLYQAGGFELEGGSGGVCTDCHAGRNPYIVHPKADLDETAGTLLMESLAGTLPTFSPGRYDPLVAASWPQNQLSHSPTLVPGVCVGCHQAGTQGGAFPHLSSELNGSPDSYCKTILRQAIDKTMPPSNPGGEASNPDVITFQNWCGTPASAGPSNRGDPHLSTTNGINYDFQSAGEFIALRNSDSGFELQTRQTPVSTTFMPGANPHTGLASCVSLNTAVAVRLGKHRITYQPSVDGVGGAERLELRVDGRLVTLPINGINLGNGSSIAMAEAGGGLDINASDGTHVIISPNYWSSEGYWYLNVEVLNTPAREGIMGHIPVSDWLPLAPDGSSFGPAPSSLADRYILLNQKFADAWRVTDKTSMFDYAPGTSTADFTDRDWPPEDGKPCIAAGAIAGPVEPMAAELAQRLCRSIEDKAAYENCVFDLTVTGEPGFAKAYLLTLYLRNTAALGIP